MISIIIYEDNPEMHELYQEVIHKFFEQRKQKIKFYIYQYYSKNLEIKFKNISGKKIFLLDIEVPGKSGLDVARAIRNSGDWMSPLIVVTGYEYLKNTGFTSKVLMLDFISKRENIRTRLENSLEIAYDIVSSQDSYIFQYNGELFHIPFNDILYFEKDLNDNYTFLYTENYVYKTKESITQIESKLKYSPAFFKVHRSCIININHVDCFNLKENRIYLGNYSTNFITRENRNFLKKKLCTYQIIK